MKLSDAEWTVMNVVWNRKPVSVRDVLERIESQTCWAYSTTKTVLTRLAEKGVLKTHKRANVTYFEPAVSRRTARRSALRSLVSKAFDGTVSSLVHHMVAQERLSKSDKAKLLAMLRQVDRGSKPK